MTNFERWKSELKPEDLADFPCVECAPFMRRECERNNPRRPLPICVAKFLEWANAEAKPEEEE